MKKLVLAAAFVALGTSAALAFGPSPSDADPPGALFASRPGGVDHVPYVVQEQEMNGAPVGLRTHDRMQSQATGLRTTR